MVINGGSYATLDFALAPTAAPTPTPTPTDPDPEHALVRPGRGLAWQVEQRDEELRHREPDPAATGHVADRHVLQLVPALHRQRRQRTPGHGSEAPPVLDRRRPERREPLQDGHHLDRDGRDVGERARPDRTSAQDDGDGREQCLGRVRAARGRDHRRRHRRVHPRRRQLQQRLLHEPRGDQQAGARAGCGWPRPPRRRRRRPTPTPTPDADPDTHAHPDPDAHADTDPDHRPRRPRRRRRPPRRPRRVAGHGSRTSPSRPGC